MKTKLFFLVIVTFLLCGCTANVNISISNDKVYERITINEQPYGDFSLSDIKQQYRNYVPAFYNIPIIDTMPDVAESGVEYYRMSGTNVGNSYNAYYQYDYSFKTYKNATSIKNAFKSSEVQYDPYEKQILFTTENSGMTVFNSYPSLSEVKINISTSYPVIEHNADYVTGNVYTWVFSKNTSKSVYLLLEDKDAKSIGGITKTDQDKKDDDKKDDDKKDDKEEPGDKKGTDNPSGEKDGSKESTTKEEESGIKKEYKKIKEEGKKHPYALIFIAIGVFFFIIICSARVKKV